jgi:riboflavin synthase
MFSGIVEAIGTITRVEDRETTRRFFVEVSAFGTEVAVGDSIAVDGACLTATASSAEGFSVDVIGTTLERTIAGRYQEGSRVNLERALLASARLDGHVVQGHVDGVGRLVRSEKDGEYWLMDFALTSEVHAETIVRGSVTLNGVSLTVSELLPDDAVRIGIIPHTHAHTNLGTLQPGDPVNVEGDVIGKYVARILARRGDGGP